MGDIIAKESMLIHGDCLMKLSLIADNSVDFILCDLPYGTTRNKWDVIIPFAPLWREYKRVIKPSGAIALFGQGLFTAKAILSNEKWYRYNLVWKKGNRVSGFLNAKRQPLRNHEDIMVFYKKQPYYNPQMERGAPSKSRGSAAPVANNNYGDYVGQPGVSPNGDMKYPKSVLNFKREHPPIFATQKPVALLKYLIETFTRPGEVVLDNAAGSFSTVIAAMEAGRAIIAIEKDRAHFDQGLARTKLWIDTYDFSDKHKLEYLF